MNARGLRTALSGLQHLDLARECMGVRLCVFVRVCACLCVCLRAYACAHTTHIHTYIHPPPDNRLDASVIAELCSALENMPHLRSLNLAGVCVCVRGVEVCACKRMCVSEGRGVR